MIRQLLFATLMLCALKPISLQAQLTAKSGELTVRGTVVAGNTQEPLEGVDIKIKGTGKGTLTDAGGRYEINVPSLADLFFSRNVEAPTLIFSRAGFQTQEIDVEKGLLMDIVLEADLDHSEEMIYTGTAGGQEKEDLCFSVGSLKDEWVKASPAPSVGLDLQGKIPGLRVNQVSGQPGQGAFFQLRSANSIANGQQPLIIIDGIYLNGTTLADINSEDIDRVEVLKGSAGASLYGSRAANGVIQIFTKNGKRLEVGDTKVTYRGEVGFSNESNRYDLSNFTNREIIDPAAPQPILGNPTPDGINDTELPNLKDYQDQFLFRKGLYHSNYLSVQGNSEKTSFLTSVQRLRDEGIIQNFDGYTRNAFRINIDHQISNKIDVEVNSMFSSSNLDLLDPTSNGPGSYIATTLFLTPIFDLEVPNEEDNTAYDWDIDNTGNGITNPLYERANSRQKVDRTRLLGSFQANYHPKKWLTLSYFTGLDRSTNAFEHFVEKGYLSTNTPGLFGNLASANIQNSNGGGIHLSNRTTSALISRLDLIARRKFGGFNGTFRGSLLYEDIMSQYTEGIGENLVVRGIRSLDNAQNNILNASEKEEIIANSGFLIADIEYKQKFFFSGLVRREGSSLFGPEERWSNYYRGSAAYRLTEDIKIKGFQDLKFRASTGTAGIRPNFDQRFETFQLVNGTVTKQTLGNKFLRPALSTEIEVGLDATFLKAFQLEFNYVKVKTEDQILLVPLSGAAGFEGQWRNAGTTEATVYEAGLNIDFKQLFKIKNRDFSWDVMTTFDRVEQTVSELDVPAYNTGPGIEQASLFLIEEGTTLGTMVGEVFATSLDQLDDQEFINAGDYTLNDAGYVVREDQLGTPDERPYKLMDVNGNPIVQQIGDINPDFRMGFAHTLTYKGLRFFTLFDWKKGGDIYNLSKQWLYRDQRHEDVSSQPDITAGFFGSDGLYNNLVVNNHFVEDGSFFMLREASLSYTFQEHQLKNVFKGLINSIRFSLIGRNLFTVTNYSGFHPDVSSVPMDENTLTNRVQGARGSDIRTPNGDPSLFAVDVFNYPVRRAYSFSLQVTF